MDSKNPLSDFELLKQHVNVSRETYDRLKLYHELLLKWQSKINLISGDTVATSWQRHFIDSLQLLPLIDKVDGKSIDLGSGAGFPGMVLAICGVSNMHLIESDGKKVSFLKEVSRITKTEVTLHHCRIEESSIDNVEYIFSRACSSLSTLFFYSEKYVSRETVFYFHKGKNYPKEILDSKRKWLFDYSIHPSATNSEGVILKITNLSKT